MWTLGRGGCLRVFFQNQECLVACLPVHNHITVRLKWNYNYYLVPNPPGGFGGRHPKRGSPVARPAPSTQYWRKVHFPEDGKYTIEPLKVTRLGGRDPVTGRVVVKTIGGGWKYQYHWVDFVRHGNLDGSVRAEKVVRLIQERSRTALLALTAEGDQMRWRLATTAMTPGVTVCNHSDIPRIPVRATEGDAHPLGALPNGTVICHVEKFPGKGAFFCRAAGTSATLLRKIDDHVIVQLPDKHHVSLNEKCMAVVGRMSNVEHGDTPIGSPNRLRWLGFRPRSGLWHRKDGYCGRKIRPLPPLKVYDEEKEVKTQPEIVLKMLLKEEASQEYVFACLPKPHPSLHDLNPRVQAMFLNILSWMKEETDLDWLALAPGRSLLHLLGQETSPKVLRGLAGLLQDSLYHGGDVARDIQILMPLLAKDRRALQHYFIHARHLYNPIHVFRFVCATLNILYKHVKGKMEKEEEVLKKSSEKKDRRSKKKKRLRNEDDSCNDADKENNPLQSQGEGSGSSERKEEKGKMSLDDENVVAGLLDACHVLLSEHSELAGVDAEEKEDFYGFVERAIPFLRGYYSTLPLLNWKRGDDLLQLISDWLEIGLDPSKHLSQTARAHKQGALRFRETSLPQPLLGVKILKAALSHPLQWKKIMGSNRSDLISLAQLTQSVKGLVSDHLQSFMEETSRVREDGFISSEFLALTFDLHLCLCGLLHHAEEDEFFFDGLCLFQDALHWLSTVLVTMEVEDEGTVLRTQIFEIALERIQDLIWINTVNHQVLEATTSIASHLLCYGETLKAGGIVLKLAATLLCRGWLLNQGLASDELALALTSMAFDAFITFPQGSASLIDEDKTLPDVKKCRSILMYLYGCKPKTGREAFIKILAKEEESGRSMSLEREAEDEKWKWPPITATLFLFVITRRKLTTPILRHLVSLPLQDSKDCEVRAQILHGWRTSHLGTGNKEFKKALEMCMIKTRHLQAESQESSNEESNSSPLTRALSILSQLWQEEMNQPQSFLEL
ncbi:unnamed protein product [Darwinula stevensoni]|uniref:Uncharacterized protein n=1 Tax=Darwinula stevensoni TaxID=69355 RepID=A0A7R8XFA6_9CRUS|nr:unnamed protein product [Darwinula stevensoni]CAG0890519.1 unnamed protein product [Darwinula stevensoni]